MSADMHIIVAPDTIPMDELKFYGTWEYDTNMSNEEFFAADDRISAVADALYHGDDAWNLDDVWVAACSPAKAGFMGDYDRYIPGAVRAINDLYTRNGGVIVITPEIIPAITTAFNMPNRSIYGAENDRSGFIPRKERMRGVNRARKVKRFLEANMGKATFVDFW